MRGWEGTVILLFSRSDALVGGLGGSCPAQAAIILWQIIWLERRPLALHIAYRFHAKHPNGGVVEWSIAPVLKTGEPKGSVGSNPTPSANLRPTMIRPLSPYTAANSFKLGVG